MASIRERTSGGGERTWQVLFRQGDKQKSRTFTDAKKAEKFRVLVEALGADRALAELLTDTRTDRLTVDDLAAKFLAWKARDVTPRTRADYQRDYDNWIKPWFGHRAADSVDEIDVQKWADHMATTLSPKSVADRHMLLHSMYAYGRAKSRSLVGHNPCLETELPKRTKKPRKGTTLGEWLAIRSSAERDNPDAADFVHFLGTLGWRFSEGAALLVDAVDDDGQNVWVDVVRVFRMIDNRQVLVEDVAKSEAGFRRTRLPAGCAAMIRRRLVGKGPRDYVFTNSRGNHWNQNTFLRTTWPSLLKAAGVGSVQRRPTPHWLRHMAVANMARAGVPVHEIQRIIGHEDVKTTNSTYGGMITTFNDTTLERLDDITSGRASDTVIGDVVVLELGQSS